MKRRSLLALMLVGILAISSFVGCGSSEETTEETTTEETTEEATTEEATTEETADASSDSSYDGLKIGFYATMQADFFDDVLVGVEQFQEDYPGVEIVVKYGSDGTISEQITGLEGLAAQGCQYILTIPADATGINSVAAELAETGVQVILFGGDSSEPHDTTMCFATATEEAAYLATVELIDAMGGEGQIINVLESLNDANTVLRKEGVERAVAETDGAVEIIQTISDMVTSEESAEKITSALAASLNEVDGFICTGFSTSIGLTNVLTEYYANDPDARTIYGVTIDCDETISKGIADGVIYASVGQNSPGMGYLALEACRLMYDGYEVVDGVHTLDTGLVMITADNYETWDEGLTAVTSDIAASLPDNYLVK